MAINPLKTLTVNDVAYLRGASVHSSLRLIRKIRNEYKRPDFPEVSIVDYCQFLGLNKDDVFTALSERAKVIPMLENGNNSAKKLSHA